MNRRCRSVLLLVACCVVALAEGSAQGAVSPQPGHSFGGITGQGQLIVITLNPKRNKIARITWSWYAPCVAGPGATGTTPADSGLVFTARYFPGILINSRGAWRSARAEESFDANGNTSRFVYRFVGRRSGGRMIGTVRTTLIKTDRMGQNIETCTTVIRFGAADRNVLADETSQQDPIVITLNPARAQIEWNWDGQCTLGPAARPDSATTVSFSPDLFVRPVKIDKRGHFRGVQTFGPLPDPRTGITRTFRYLLVGSRSGQLIEGTITANITEADTATGGLIRTCSSGPVKFHATD